MENNKELHLTVEKTVIDLGLKEEIRFLHVTDSHIAKAYDHEGADLLGLAAAREKYFDKGVPGQSVRLYEEAKQYAKDNNLLMIHTGDLIDFLSEANFDYLDHAFDGIDHIYAAGNHDFCHFVGRAAEDWYYKQQNMKKIAPHVKYNMHFDSRVVGGVNIVTLDDTYYNITAGQVEMLRAEAARGLPILLFMHVPLYIPEYAKERLKFGPAYMVAAPREIIEKYSSDRFLQQSPTEETLRAVEYIKSEPMIKAIFCGHTHENIDEKLDNGVMQYIAGATYEGFAREFVIK